MCKKDVVAFIQMCQGGLAQTVYERMMLAGWRYHEAYEREDADYTDIHTDSFYEGGRTTGKSLDAWLTITWPNKTFYLSFGLNKGDGFDCLAVTDFQRIGDSFADELDKAAYRDQSGELLRVLNKNPTVKADMQNKLRELQTILSFVMLPAGCVNVLHGAAETYVQEGGVTDAEDHYSDEDLASQEESLERAAQACHFIVTGKMWQVGAGM